jgi:hypothetical protein
MYFQIIDNFRTGDMVGVFYRSKEMAILCAHGYHVRVQAECERDCILIEHVLIPDILTHQRVNKRRREKVCILEFIRAVGTSRFGIDDFYSLVSCGVTLLLHESSESLWSYLYSNEERHTLSNLIHEGVFKRVDAVDTVPQGYVRCSDKDVLAYLVLSSQFSTCITSQNKYAAMVRMLGESERVEKIDALLRTSV